MSSLLRILSLSLVYPLLAGCLRCNAESPENISRRENVLERFKLPRESKCLLVPIEIKGKKYGFILDTGGTLTCYDKSFRSSLGDPVRSGTMHTPDGERKVPLFRPLTAKLGRLDLPTKSFILCNDYGKWRETLKQEIHGALGMDFLKEHAFRIDFRRAEVTFLRSVGTDSGLRVPVTFNDYDRPQIEVSLSGLQNREKFLVDTGSVGITGGSLFANVFDSLVKGGSLKLIGETHFETALGTGSSRKGRLDSITLGNHQLKDLLFTRAKRSVLSLNFFSHFDMVTFDFPNKALYLKNAK